MMIKLTRGKFAIVDNEDFERVNRFKWYANESQPSFWYAARRRGRNSAFGMHRFILDAPEGMFVDHINHNGLDNRRCNIRLCSCRQNNQNSRMPKTKNKSSIYKGVSWCTPSKKWKVAIRVLGGRLYLGYFDCEKEAAGKYNEAALKHFGEFACLNQVKKCPSTYCGDYEEKEIIDEWGFCAFCDKMFGEFIDEHKED